MTSDSGTVVTDVTSLLRAPRWAPNAFCQECYYYDGAVIVACGLANSLEYLAENDRGTAFLDEVGALPLAARAKLRRAVEMNRQSFAESFGRVSTRVGVGASAGRRAMVTGSLRTSSPG